LPEIPHSFHHAAVLIRDGSGERDVGSGAVIDLDDLLPDCADNLIDFVT